MGQHERSGPDDGTRFGVWSTDGTSIAVWVEGRGPPLVMVHGSLRHHVAFAPLVAELRDSLTTYAVDRRGFGASGDSGSYSIEQEFRDVAAVVEEVAARTGERVAVLGHSFGANPAMGGAALTDRVSRLVLNEPSLGLPYPPGWIETNERVLAAGDIEAVVRSVLIDLAGMSEELFAERRAGPQWADYLAAGPTIVREAHVESEWVYGPGAMDGITARTLMLVGSESPQAVLLATLRALAAIPDARPHILEGHGHFAHLTDPAFVADLVIRFVGEPE
jgi:pimeloyl-ACP methyl ester carboxylesterase